LEIERVVYPKSPDAATDAYVRDETDIWCAARILIQRHANDADVIAAGSEQFRANGGTVE
jgi:hypothetical protein